MLLQTFLFRYPSAHTSEFHRGVHHGVELLGLRALGFSNSLCIFPSCLKCSRVSVALYLHPHLVLPDLICTSLLSYSVLNSLLW